MTTYKNLLVDRIGTDEHIARVTLNRPDKANTLSTELVVELDDCLHELEAEQLGMINYAWPSDELEQKTLAFA